MISYKTSGGGTILQSKTVTPLITNEQQIIVPDQDYDGLDQVTIEPMAEATLATPTINSSGYITAKASTAGFINTSTTIGLQLSTQPTGTITPGTSRVLAIANNTYTTGNIYVAGDSNLVSNNIISGKSIFGVSGNANTTDKQLFMYQGSGNGSSTIDVTMTGYPNKYFPNFKPIRFVVYATSIDTAGYNNGVAAMYSLNNKDTSLYYYNGSYYGASSMGSQVIAYDSNAPTVYFTNSTIKFVGVSGAQTTWRFESVFNKQFYPTWTYLFIIIGTI